jgi:hypothetical protein
MPIRRLAVPLALAAGCLLVGSPASRATLMRVLELPELVAEADQVVVADVLAVRAAWDREHRAIHTTVEVGVAESWKGRPPGDGRLTIRHLGGTVGEIEMTVHGSPTFAVGERALLFVRASQVVGMSQGKRSLRWEAGSRRWLVGPADRAAAVVPGPQGTLRAAGRDSVEALDDLREKVRALVGK